MMNDSKLKREQYTAVIKKVLRHDADREHGGAWKIAFVDLLLAMLGFFILLWVLAIKEQEAMQEVQAGQSEIHAEHAQHGSTPNGGRLLSGDLERPVDRQQLAQVLMEISSKAGLSDNVQIVSTPYGLRMTLHDTDQQGMFERGSVIIAPRFKALLLQIGKTLSALDSRLLLIGHTDAAQYNSPGFNFTTMSNWALSSNRAMVARMHLKEGGLDDHSILQVVGMADRAPLDQKNPLAAVNRRIEVQILSADRAQAVIAMYSSMSASQ